MEEECNEIMNTGDMHTITCKLHKGHCSDHLAVIYWNNKDSFNQFGDSTSPNSKSVVEKTK